MIKDMGHIFCVLSLALLFMNVKIWGLSFTVEPQDKVIAVGQPLLLNCVANHTGSGTVVITWKRNGQWLLNLIGKNYRYFQNNSLFFETTTDADVGDYLCGAVIDGTSNIIYSRTAKVAKAYIEATFVTPPSNAIARVGATNIHFSCVSGNSVPHASIYWEKDGQRFTGGQVTNFVIPSSNWTSSSLLIRNVKFNHAGSYRSVAINPLLPLDSKRSPEALLTVLPAQNQPHFLVQPTNQIAKENLPTLLQCIVLGIPAPLVSWTHNSVAVQNTSQRFMFANGSLFFPAMNRSMAGEYKCLGANSLGSVTSSPVLLTVAYFDYVFLKNPTNKTVTVGESVSLECVPPCSNPAAVVIHWYRNYQQIQPQVGAVTISSSGTLTITSPKKSDDGKYFCDGTNSILQQSRTSSVAYLTVNVPPSFLIKPENTSVVQLQVLWLHCQATGLPVPRLQWLKDGIPVNNSGRVTVHSNGSLSILSTQVSDAGKFSCEAENVAGKNTVLVYVAIYVPPSVVQQPSNATRTVGESVRFECTFSGTPKPTVSWFHVVGDSQVLLGNSLSNILTNGWLEVRQLTKRNEGKYICRATNVAGTTISSAFLKVQVPVSLETHPVNITVNQSSAASFHCSASGDPKPTVTWYKGGIQLSHGGRVVITEDTLTILNTSAADSGKYSCNVSNGLASHVGTASLIVQVAPTITLFQVPSLKRMSHNATLRCSATGIPTPRVSWVKDGISIPQQSNGPMPAGLISLINLKGTDSGTYVCTAMNVVGRISAGGNLTVQVPPSKPTSLLALPLSATSVLVSWQPGFDGHSPLTGYKLSWSTGSLPVMAVDGITETTYTVTSLEPYSVYNFSVRSQNAIGYGEAANMYNRTLEAAPSAPVVLETRRVNSTAIRLTWEKPKKENGVVTHYAIEYRVLGDSHVTRVILAANEVAELTVLIGNLKPYTEYMFKVQAATGGQAHVTHWGNYSEYSNTRTDESAPSAAPTDVELSSTTAHEILVKFKPVPSGSENGIIRGYNIYFMAVGPVHSSNVTLTFIKENTTLHHTLTSLLPWTIYNVSISAVTIQEGPTSSWKQMRTGEAAPSQPPMSIHLASDSEHSLLVNITPPASQFHNGALKGYIVYYSATSSGPLHNVTTVNTSVRLTELEVYTEYTVWVSAFTRAGAGPKSESKEMKTQESVPGRPQGFAKSAASHNSITVSWKAPEKPNGKLTKYTLYYNSSNEPPSTTKVIGASETNYELTDLTGNTTFYIWIWAHTSKGPGPREGPLIVTTGPAPIPTSQAKPTTTLPPKEPNSTALPTEKSGGNASERKGFLNEEEQIVLIACCVVILVVLLLFIVYFIIIRPHSRKQTSFVSKNGKARAVEMGVRSPDRLAVLELQESAADSSAESESVSSWDSSLPNRPRWDSRATEQSNETVVSSEFNPKPSYALFDAAQHTGKSPLVKLRNKRISLESSDSLYDQPYSSVEELGGGFTSFTPSPLIEDADQDGGTANELTATPVTGDRMSFTNELYKAAQADPALKGADTDEETDAFVGGVLAVNDSVGCGLENKGYDSASPDTNLDTEVSIGPPVGFKDEEANTNKPVEDPKATYAQVDLSKKTRRPKKKQEESDSDDSDTAHPPTLVYDERTNL